MKKKFSVALLLVLCLLLAGCGKKSVLPDGTYSAELTLEGGTGRTTLQSPAHLTVLDGKMTVQLIWSSRNYDYMMVGGTKYLPSTMEPGSTFLIPVTALDQPMAVSADTTAMSTPHDIAYTLTVHAPGRSSAAAEQTAQTVPTAAAEISVVSQELIKSGSMELSYAEGFCVDYYEGGYALLTILGDGSRYLTIPEGKTAPADLAADVTPLYLPLNNIYLTATAVMDMFISLDALDTLGFTGTKAEGWHLPEAKAAMERGDLLYAGSYAAPDYEQIRAAKCPLAIENTMISHAPEVKEQLERFGVPVLIDRSSYEVSPLGRVEWVKVYGLLTGKEDAAQAAFDQQVQQFQSIAGDEPTNKTVAFFYITSTGEINGRRSSDYIPKMIEMAGGVYLPENIGDAGTSNAATLSMQMESFYAAARDADFLVYNSTIDGTVPTLDALIAKDSLLANFKAVREGNVFCTTENQYQSSMKLGTLILDLHQMLTGDRAGMTYLYHLE